MYTVNSDTYKLTQKVHGRVVIFQTGVQVETLQTTDFERVVKCLSLPRRSGIVL